jgi:hypothetical protein
VNPTIALVWSFSYHAYRHHNVCIDNYVIDGNEEMWRQERTLLSVDSIVRGTLSDGHCPGVLFENTRCLGLLRMRIAIMLEYNGLELRHPRIVDVSVLWKDGAALSRSGICAAHKRNMSGAGEKSSLAPLVQSN